MQIPRGGILIDEIFLYHYQPFIDAEFELAYPYLQDLQVIESPAKVKKSEDRRRNILGKKGRW
jgi:hypothetical protein